MGVLCAGISAANADSIDAANRLLRVTDMGDRFESMALQQTRDIIRTYSSIVSMSAEVSLPVYLKRSIADCYAEVYAWDKFRPGIAQILAEVLNRKELLLLIDFYSSRSLPPREIPTFKAVIEKAEQIQLMTTDYIYDHASSCVDRDAELIFSYLDSLANYRAPGEAELAAEQSIE